MTVAIADDYTGAAEVAGICLEKGVPVRFLTGIPSAEDLSTTDARVVVIATDTRSMSRDEACLESRRIGRALQDAGVKDVFKKTDSAMRGWILDEMAALAGECGFRRLRIQTANPRLGRTIRGGCYYIGEKPVAETAFASDPEFPAHSSSVSDLLLSRSGFNTMPWDTCDAVSEEDLVASLPEGGGGDVLCGGSAGFWAAYLDSRTSARDLDWKEKPESVSLKGNLMVCGSAHQNSRRFLSEAREKGWRVLEIGSDPGVGTDEGLIVTFPDESEGNSLMDNYMAFTVAATALIRRCSPRHIFLEGGETACIILSGLGWKKFVPEFQWSPGVVQLRLEEDPSVHIVLKPGSYPWPEAFLAD